MRTYAQIQKSIRAGRLITQSDRDVLKAELLKKSTTASGVFHTANALATQLQT